MDKLLRRKVINLNEYKEKIEEKRKSKEKEKIIKKIIEKSKNLDW